MCSEVIVEASEDTEGQDAIFYDRAECQVWYHRWCTGVTKRRYEILDGSEAPFFCPTCVVNHQSCKIAALHDAVKALTAQLSELQLQHTDKRSSTMQQQPWSEVVRSGNKGKGKGKGGVSLAGEMPGKAESKPAGMSGGRDKIRVVGACRIWIL